MRNETGKKSGVDEADAGTQPTTQMAGDCTAVVSPTAKDLPDEEVLCGVRRGVQPFKRGDATARG
jgi:hypothetical protein